MNNGILTYLTLLLVGFLTIPDAHGQKTKEIDFSRSITRAYRIAKKTQKPIFVFVYTSWSTSSQRMYESTFQDPKIINEIESYYVPVHINAARNTSFAKDFDIHLFPTYLILNQHGHVLIRDLEYKDTDGMLRLLNRAKSGSHYLRENIDSLISVLDDTNILQTIDSIRHYRGEYSAKNLAVGYLETHKKEWSSDVCMKIMSEYFTVAPKYMKFVSKNHKYFFAKFDSLRIKENIAFHVFVNTMKSDARGRPVFDFKRLKRWFRRFKIHGYDKMEDFIRIKYFLWGRGPSVRSSINLIQNYPETTDDNVLYSSVIRLLITKSRRNTDYQSLIDAINSTLSEGTSYWRYDLLSLLYYKSGNDQKAQEAISIAQDIASIIGDDYQPTLEFIKDKIDR